MRTLIDKINHFESLPSQTVRVFNEIFTTTPLVGVNEDLEVEIGELADTDTTRMLTIGTLIVKHNFTSAKASEIAEYNNQQRENNYE